MTVSCVYIRNHMMMTMSRRMRAPVSQADPVEEAVEEIDDNVQRLVAQAMADATAENLKAQAAQEAAEGPEDLSDTAEFPPAPQAEEEPEEEPVHGTRRIDFGNLQFGRDYEIMVAIRHTSPVSCFKSNISSLILNKCASKV